MDTIAVLLSGIVALFFILLALKNIFSLKRLCVICASIILTWILLLTLYSLNIFTDKIIIAILMGHTSLGIYYIFEKKVKKNLLIFRLPLLLTFIFIIYYILESFSLDGFVLTIILWAFFALVYLFKNNKVAKKIIECCKKW